MKDNPNTDTSGTVQVRRAGWEQILMICKACEKRSKAPKKFGAKRLAKTLSQALRAAKQPKTRVVYTSCMGLCPKQAIAVGAAGGDGPVKLVAWRKADDAAAAVAVLFPQAMAEKAMSSQAED